MVSDWGAGKMALRAVAMVVLPEEVGPDRARRRGRWLGILFEVLGFLGGCCCCSGVAFGGFKVVATVSV